MRPSCYTLGGMKRIGFSALTVAVVVALVGCSSDPGPAGRVGVAEFAKVIDTPGVEIIDVRTPEEFAESHIKGAVNIPVQDPGFAAQVARLDRTRTYAVYCRSGNRSKPAVAAMRDVGFAHIFELDSGTKGWAAEGQPLTR